MAKPAHEEGGVGGGAAGSRDTGYCVFIEWVEKRGLQAEIGNWGGGGGGRAAGFYLSVFCTAPPDRVTTYGHNYCG